MLVWPLWMGPSSCQEREAQEQAQLDAVDEGGEEAEEEEDRTDDEIIETGTKHSKTTAAGTARVRVEAPQLALGSLQAKMEQAKAGRPKKSQAKKKKTEEIQPGDDVQEVGGESVGGNEGVREVYADEKLKVVAEALGTVPPCLNALLPGKILEGKQKFGHQLKGVTLLQTVGPRSLGPRLTSFLLSFGVLRFLALA